MSHSMSELIERKRDGGTLSRDEIAWIISEYTADRVPDYQMSALLMAIVFRSMDATELAAWTEAMLHSGDVLDLSSVSKPKVDKHSTGGVGDKISIPLAPVVAACGVAVPMMSGRGLGHTGGTLDKLESIAGFDVDVNPEEFPSRLAEVGMVMVGQTETLVPADRRIYALRDATGTVPSIPLISSSIMSKKLAEDLDGLLLDVKVGSGAFMRTQDEARVLAETMVGIGRSHDTPVTALLTNMDQPLGAAVGNANEIRESIETLQGDGPDDVTRLTMRFAAEMLVLAGMESDLGAATARAEAALASGAALEVFTKAVEAHGGDPRVVADTGRLPKAPHRHEITASEAGFVERCDARSIGMAAVRLGAGRATKEDDIDPGVGFEIVAKVGAAVGEGDVLAFVDYADDDRLGAALELAESAWQITDHPVGEPSLILEVVS